MQGDKGDGAATMRARHCGCNEDLTAEQSHADAKACHELACPQEGLGGSHGYGQQSDYGEQQGDTVACLEGAKKGDEGEEGESHSK